MKQFQLIFMLILTTGFMASAQSADYDFQQNFEKARDNGKHLLMVFSGSDWCKPCMQLKRNILTDQAFTAFSADRLLLYEVDFPYKRKNKLSKSRQAHNDALAAKYNEEGAFPKVLLFDENKEVVKVFNYDPYMTVDEFIFVVNSKIEKQH